MERIKDKFRGCLIGGAAGDALGYPVEFMRLTEIQAEYGECGITRYRLKKKSARISDDTQMTLFTAGGLLSAYTKGAMCGSRESIELHAWASYCDWYKTQIFRNSDQVGSANSWLCSVDELYSRRAPGFTCLSAIRDNKPGTIESPVNNSKGCGGLMRVAPVGLFCRTHPISDPIEIAMLGAKLAALTHGHPLGYIPAATFAYLIYAIASDDQSTSLQRLVENSIEVTRKCFPDSESCDVLCKLMNKAIELSSQSIDDISAINELGAGKVAEETLAIAVYCALKYSNDFEKAIIAAVNHDGDSDSTGAVCGNISGAYLGLSAIPIHYMQRLEIKDMILDMADDLYTGCIVSKDKENDTPEQKRWLARYYH